MRITALHIGRRVRWTDRGTTYTGTLHQLPEPGTPTWWHHHGKALVLLDIEHRAIPNERYRQWLHVHPSDLELVDEEVPVDG